MIVLMKNISKITQKNYEAHCLLNFIIIFYLLTGVNNLKLIKNEVCIVKLCSLFLLKNLSNYFYIYYIYTTYYRCINIYIYICTYIYVYYMHISIHYLQSELRIRMLRFSSPLPKFFFS